MKKSPRSFFELKSTKSFGIFDFEPKKVFWVPVPWALLGPVHAVFSHLCYVGLFGCLSDLRYPPRGVELGMV